jgi:hypothetical protein
LSEDPQERFRRISARMLEPGLREEELEELAREWVEVKEEVLRMHGLSLPVGREDVVAQHLERLKRLRKTLGIDR